MDFDSFEDWPEPELSPYQQAVEPAPAVATVRPRPSPRSTSAADAASRFESGAAPIDDAPSQRLNGDAVAKAAPVPRRRPGELPEPGPAGTGARSPTSSPQHGGLGLAIDVSAKREGGVLEDDDQIREMIGVKMAAYISRLNACYERQLKDDSSLQGRWRISYTVAPSGVARNATATGLNGSNPAFEACIAGDIASHWRFEKIYRDQPVQRTLTFRPR